MEHQDWSTVILTKKSAGGSKKATNDHLASGNFETTVKKTFTDPKLKKLENDTENFEHDKVSANLSNTIIKARLAKKMSRADLARAINEQEKVVADYETRKAIPEPKYLNKMSKVLGVWLNKMM
jgi:putative transcription factor